MTELSNLPDHVWAQLSEGAAGRKAGFRIAQAASVGADGAPRQRTVVIRGVDPVARTLWFHTDIRAPKAGELRARPAISLVVYNGDQGQQIRLDGTAALHHDDDRARAYWAAERPQSLMGYRSPYAPGAPLSAKDAAALPDLVRAPAAPDRGIGNFCAVVVRVHRLDWLDLAADGHRRAIFDWCGDDWRGAWAAP